MYELNVKKYPWLISKYESWDSEGRPEIEEYEVLDSLPEGWLISFGDLMCADLDEVIRRDHLSEFRIDEAKEKWGAMRIYSSGGNDATEDIIDDYSHLSENICMICGKPDVYMTNNGWYFPCCKDCWEHGDISTTRTYDEVIDKSESNMMDTERQITLHRDGVTRGVTFDLTERGNRIREYWKERFE